MHPLLELGREVCGDEGTSSQREWLVTNGIGGFAAGTVGDVLMRRYHGLLFAAMKPPLGRTLLLTKLDATLGYGGRSYALCTNRWASGAVDPRGYREIERFRLVGSIPIWSFAVSDVLLDRAIWMAPGENVTYVRYEVRTAGAPVTLTLRALVNARDYHALTRAYDVGNAVAIDGRSARVQLNAAAPELHLTSDAGKMTRGEGWYYGFRLDVESARGLDDVEDHYHAVTIAATLVQGESITVVASTSPRSPVAAADALGQREQHDAAVLATWRRANPELREPPEWIGRLVLAADQFVADRATLGVGGKTIVAGYPWFGDWGRDTMIALPGLTLVTGRAATAATILRTFAGFLDRGMLPNRFPDAGEAPEYNTADATLWFVEAIRRYVERTGDEGLMKELFSALAAIVAEHVRGTRFDIHVDETDGLLYAGEAGVQLTWMDAKVGDRVVTPRTGKPVEINALWYSALVTIRNFARRLGRDAETYGALADRARASFGRFWNEATGYCFDVIDGPAGSDPSIRPNAVIAASLVQTTLTLEQRTAILAVASRELLTSYGLRTLAPNDPNYRGCYEGNPAQRDEAYHEGTVWPWLIGPFISAHASVHHDPARALTILEGFENLSRAYGLGSIPEIADGDAPYLPRGCIAQAWSVGEILRVWHELHQAAPPGRTS